MDRSLGPDPLVVGEFVEPAGLSWESTGHDDHLPARAAKELSIGVRESDVLG
jgi:hypothetical protein